MEMKEPSGISIEEWERKEKDLLSKGLEKRSERNNQEPSKDRHIGCYSDKNITSAAFDFTIYLILILIYS